MYVIILIHFTYKYFGDVMKKLCYLIVCFFSIVFMSLIALCYEKPIQSSVRIIDELDKTIDIYYIYDNSLKKASLPSVGDDQIREIFDYLSSSANYAPKDYYSVVPNSTILLSYEITDNLVKLNVTKQFLLYNEKDILYLAALINENYLLLGYEGASISINGSLHEKINQLMHTKRYKDYIKVF